MNTSLIYSGKISVQILNKKFRVYNNGEDKLFELFARALVDPQSIQNQELPSYINLVYSESSNSTPEDVINQFIPITRTYRDKKCIITGSITDGNLDIPETIKLDNLPTTAAFKLQLLDGTSDADRLLATADFSSKAVKQITTGRQAIIEWELSVGNKTNTEVVK